jgi:hypothetical protein
MPALLDTIRDQIGMEQADAFKASVEPLLANMTQQLSGARSTADDAARALAGEPVAAPMGMGAAPGGMPGQMPAPDMTSDMDTDSFAATDAAAGPNVVGREKR